MIETVSKAMRARVGATLDVIARAEALDVLTRCTMQVRVQAETTARIPILDGLVAQEAAATAVWLATAPQTDQAALRPEGDAPQRAVLPS